VSRVGSSRGWEPVALVLLALVALAVAVPLWGPGLVNTRGEGDSPFLLQRVDQLVVNLRAGVFPVRWMPDAAYGLGYPFFNYYSALPYYLAGGFVLIGLDVLTAIKLVQTLGFLASALAMYGWMRSTGRRVWVAWLAGVAYAVAPFHLVNVYVRGDSLSEFYAFVFYPLILWGLECALAAESTAMRKGPWRSVAWLWPALAYAGLISAHNISAFIFSPFVVLYVLVLALRRREVFWRSIVLGIMSLGVGVLLTAWISIPALAERCAVQTHLLTGGFFDYALHFRRVDLVQWRALFDYGVNASGGDPFSMGLVQAILAAAGAVVLAIRAVRKHEQFLCLFVLAGLLLSTLMITPLSGPLWSILPLLPVIQFPWRFLSVQSLFTAAATAVLVPEGHWGRWYAVAIASILLISMLVPLRPERLPIEASDVTTERLQLYELFTQNIGTTIRYEWLPQSVVPRPFLSNALISPEEMLPVIPLDGADVGARLLDRQPIRQTWEVWGEGGGVAFPLFYWPGWRAYVDGQAVDVEPVEGSGYLSLRVPSGSHLVVLKLGRTWVRAVAESLSLVTLVGVIAVVFLNWQQIPSRKVEIGLVIIALPVLVLLVVPQDVHYADTDLTMDFDRMPYLHHNPGGINFGSDVFLAGYRLSAEEASPGDTIEIQMDWASVAEDYSVSVRLVSPAVSRQMVRPLAETTCRFHDSACSSMALEIPEDTSRGVYLFQLQVNGPDGEVRALTADGEPMGTLYLKSVRVATGPVVDSEASVLTPFGSAIRLHSGILNQVSPGRLEVQLAWSVERPVAVNYGISLRIIDGEEQVVAVTDTQPGYGFLPTSLWRPGELTSDRYSLELPDDIKPGELYYLVVILYQVSSGEVLGQARLGNFVLPLESQVEIKRPPRVFELPTLENELDVNFGEQVKLSGYELVRTDNTVRLTLWWQSLLSMNEDYKVFVHLFDPTDETIVVQSDAMPQWGGYPTSWWVSGEVVSETIVLPLKDVQPGVYRLGVGLYDRDLVRLVAADGANGRLPGDRVVLPDVVEVAE